MPRRLALDVLLSFAQFEREATAERIRDQTAASGRKGMWGEGRRRWATTSILTSSDRCRAPRAPAAARPRRKAAPAANGAGVQRVGEAVNSDQPALLTGTFWDESGDRLTPPTPPGLGGSTAATPRGG